MFLMTPEEQRRLLSATPATPATPAAAPAATPSPTPAKTGRNADRNGRDRLSNHRGRRGAARRNAHAGGGKSRFRTLSPRLRAANVNQAGWVSMLGSQY